MNGRVDHLSKCAVEAPKLLAEKSIEKTLRKLAHLNEGESWVAMFGIIKSVSGISVMTISSFPME